MKTTDWEQQASEFIAAQWPGLAGLSHPAAIQLASVRWYQALAEQGWSVAHWPTEQGGANWSKRQLYRWQMLCQQAQTPPLNTLAMSVVAPLLMAESRSEHRRWLLQDIAAFSAHWCLGLLEPVNAASPEPCRLVNDGADVVLHGVKRALGDGLLASTELANDALWPRQILCVALDQHGHWRCCLVPLDRTGVTLEPVANQRGRWFQVTFDGVRVSAEELLERADESLLTALADSSLMQQAALPSVSSYVLAEQLDALREHIEAESHEETPTLLTQLAEAEVGLAALQALEVRALSPVSPQLPEPLPVPVLNTRAQELQQQIGSLQLASIGYYAVPMANDLQDHNQGPVNPAANTVNWIHEGLNALAASHYGWDPKDVLARYYLGLDGTGWLDQESSSEQS